MNKKAKGKKDEDEDDDVSESEAEEERRRRAEKELRRAASSLATPAPSLPSRLSTATRPLISARARAHSRT